MDPGTSLNPDPNRIRNPGCGPWIFLYIFFLYHWHITGLWRSRWPARCTRPWPGDPRGAAVSSSQAHSGPPRSVFLISFIQQCCGSLSRILCRFDPWTRIPNPYFLELSDKFLGKKFYNSLKTGQNFLLQQIKNKGIFNFVKFVATKKRYDNQFFFIPLFCWGFWIQDPGSEIRDRYKIRIRVKHPGSATLGCGGGIEL